MAHAGPGGGAWSVGGGSDLQPPAAMSSSSSSSSQVKQQQPPPPPPARVSMPPPQLVSVKAEHGAISGADLKNLVPAPDESTAVVVSSGGGDGSVVGGAGASGIGAASAAAAAVAGGDGGEDAEGSVDPEAIYGQVFADFVQSLDEFTPTIPDAVTSYYMSSAGFQVDDPRLLRLISLSCQKFIADVTNDAMQHCKIRTAQQLKNQKQTKPRFQLTLEDLLPTLKERGISIKKPHYFI